jgi:hypothetical protein
MHLWDRFLPQAVLTLNMLTTSRISPKISVATHLDGQYNYNRAPMAPPGNIIIAHETPNHRQTWAPHEQDGWYIRLLWSIIKPTGYKLAKLGVNGW